jgi:CRP-like cAMP-binding protein
VGDRFYIVEAGEVAVQRTLEDGQVEEVARLGPGEYVGEIALLMGLTRVATVVAREPTTLLTLSAGDFDELIRSSQGVHNALERTGSRRILLNERLGV